MMEIVIENQAGATIGRTELDQFLNMGDSVILAEGSESYVLAELVERDLSGRETQTVMVGPLSAAN